MQTTENISKTASKVYRYLKHVAWFFASCTGVSVKSYWEHKLGLRRHGCSELGLMTGVSFVSFVLCRLFSSSLSETRNPSADPRLSHVVSFRGEHRITPGEEEQRGQVTVETRRPPPVESRQEKARFCAALTLNRLPIKLY